jgi:hypothetical protein
LKALVRSERPFKTVVGAIRGAAGACWSVFVECGGGKESAGRLAQGAGDTHEVDVAAGHESNTGMSHPARVPRVHNVV